MPNRPLRRGGRGGVRMPVPNKSLTTIALLGAARTFSEQCLEVFIVNPWLYKARVHFCRCMSILVILVRFRVVCIQSRHKSIHVQFPENFWSYGDSCLQGWLDSPEIKNRGPNNHDSQRRDRILRNFLRPEIGQFSPHFGAMSLLKYTVNLEKRGKIHWRKFKKENPVQTAPRNCRPLSLVVAERVLKNSTCIDSWEGKLYLRKLHLQERMAPVTVTGTIWHQQFLGKSKKLHV